MKKIRILLADDHNIMRRGLRLLLERQPGFEVVAEASDGRQAAERLKVPFFRLGIPTFDRLGAAHQLTVGYRGTRNLIFDIGNLLMAHGHENTPDTWRRGSSAQHAEAQLAGAHA